MQMYGQDQYLFKVLFQRQTQIHLANVLPLNTKKQTNFNKYVLGYWGNEVLKQLNKVANNKTRGGFQKAIYTLRLKFAVSAHLFSPI
jgi:hypothetical protein